MQILAHYQRGPDDRAIVLHHRLLLDLAVHIEGTRAVPVAGEILVVAELSDDEGRDQAAAIVDAGGYLKRVSAGERQLCRTLTSADLAGEVAVDPPQVAEVA